MTDQPDKRPEDEPATGEPAPPPQEPPAYGTTPPAYGATPPADEPPAYAPPPAAAPTPAAQQPADYQAYPQSAPGAGGYSSELSPSDQRMWAMLAHLGAILFGFLAPLVVYLVQKDRGQYVREQSREALNFNITLLIAYVVVGILTVVTFGLAGILFFALIVLNILFPILGGLAANKGENYRYPINWRLVS